MAHNLLLFYAFAALAVASTLLVIVQPHPIYGVLLFSASSASLAGLYVLLDAPLFAGAQIVVCAGAIPALFLFVVILLKVPREAPLESDTGGSESARWVGAMLTVALAFQLALALNRSQAVAAPAGGERDAAAAIGRAVVGDYSIALAATAGLIFAAMVGATSLAGRDRTEKNPWQS